VWVCLTRRALLLLTENMLESTSHHKSHIQGRQSISSLKVFIVRKARVPPQRFVYNRSPSVSNREREIYISKMTTKPTIAILPAEFPRDKALVAEFFNALAGTLPPHINLVHQSFEDELAQLPGKYVPEKGGDVFLAYASTPTKTTCVGCVAIRALDVAPNVAPNTCELKRLWTTDESRGLGAGRALLVAAMARAKEMGYEWMLLDTLEIFKPAKKLYDQNGFVLCEKYNNNPHEGVLFMKAPLA
jgi:GNAT superfamily N-acetyltransferase